MSYVGHVLSFDQNVQLLEISLGAIQKLRHTNLMIFLPLPLPCQRWSYFWDTLHVTYFAILRLEIIELKQQKFDVTKFRIPPPPCYTMSHFFDPSAPLLACDVIYGCPLKGCCLHSWIQHFHEDQKDLTIKNCVFSRTYTRSRNARTIG